MIDKFSRALALMREARGRRGRAMFIPSVDLAAEVDGAQRVINAASAVQSLRVAQFAGREHEQGASGAWVEVDHGVGHLGEFAEDCFGPMLSMGSVAAGRKVQTAVALASRPPATLAAMSAGDLDAWRATIIAAELCEAGRQSYAAVEALIFPAVLDETPGAVTRRVRRVLAGVDADAVRLKAARARLDRFVQAYPSEVPGLTKWVASLPAAESAACWAAIDELAHRMRGDDQTRTLEQCRADALVDLMLGNVNSQYGTLGLRCPEYPGKAWFIRRRCRLRRGRACWSSRGRHGGSGRRQPHEPPCSWRSRRCSLRAALVALVAQVAALPPLLPSLRQRLWPSRP
jgi:hypothetical protein